VGGVRCHEHKERRIREGATHIQITADGKPTNSGMRRIRIVEDGSLQPRPTMINSANL